MKSMPYPYWRKHGSYCPGDITLQTVPDLEGYPERLRKKKYVTVEMTDDGPRYHAKRMSSLRKVRRAASRYGLVGVCEAVGMYMVWSLTALYDDPGARQV